MINGATDMGLTVAPSEAELYPVRWANGEQRCRASESQAQDLIQAGLGNWKQGHTGWYVGLFADQPERQLKNAPRDASQAVFVTPTGSFLKHAGAQTAVPLYRHKQSKPHRS